MLHNIRQAQAGQFVEITPRSLRWRPDTACWGDVAAFERLLDRVDEFGDDVQLSALREAVEAYTGDLLAGSYDDWLLPERERLRGRYLEALEQLSGLLHAQGDNHAATAYAERLLREDPLREATYRLLMGAYEARGDRARALRTYHLCASTLERELDVAPSRETQAAYAALLPATSSAGQRRAQRPSGPPLVGRATERNRLVGAWRATEGGGAQLIMLTGEPGIGKTRLAEEFGRWCARRGAAIAAARAHAAEGSLAYAPVVGDAVLVVEGAYVLGIAAFWQARFEAAREHFELAVRRYRPEHRGVHLLRYGQDTHVVCASRLANTLWFLGKPTEATQARDTALALAKQTGHPFSRAIALFFAALLARDMDDEPHLRRYTAELAAIGHEARPIRAGTEALNGYLEVLDGDVAGGLARCRRSVDAERDLESAPGSRAVVERVLLAACVAAGNTRGGLAAAERLLGMGDAARVWRTEAQRLRDELLARNT